MIEIAQGDRSGAAVVDEVKSQQPPQPPQPPSGPLVALSNERLVEYVTTRAADMADVRAAKRDLQYRAVVGVVVVGLGFLGYQHLDTAVDDRTKSIESTLDQRTSLIKEEARTFQVSIQAEVDAMKQTYDYRLQSLAAAEVGTALKGQATAVSELDTRLANLRAAIQEMDSGFQARSKLERFRADVADWNKNGGISTPDMEASLVTFGDLTKSSDPIVKAAMPDLASDYTGLMTAIDNERGHHAVDVIDDAARQWLMARPPDAGIMATHYALRLLGTQHPRAEDEERFGRYTKVLHDLGYANFALPHELALAFVRSKSDPQDAKAAENLGALEDAALHLERIERGALLHLLDALAEPQVNDVPAARAYQEYMSEHADFIAALRLSAAEPK